jgi:hypothetical protein
MTSGTSGEGVLSPFSGLGIFMSLIQGRRAPLRSALAPGYLLLRLRRTSIAILLVAVVAL